jgi:hypothetical protein
MNFITFFDINYLPKGLVCYKTLFKYNLTNLFVVCLDNYTYNFLQNKEKIIPINITDIEKYDKEYYDTKTTRSLTSYYITLSPILPLYVIDKYNLDVFFYTDADMAFWSDPEEILEIFGNKSLMVTDHGIEPPRNNIRFNNGIIGYRNDANSIEFLNWWRKKCLEWCGWSTVDGKCGEQGYLNIIYNEPSVFKNTLICPNPGVNTGPWNIAKYNVKNENGQIKIYDNEEYNLICYHYHEFRYINDYLYYPTGWKHTELHKQFIYEPYFKLIKNARREVGFEQSRLDLTNIGKEE